MCGFAGYVNFSNHKILDSVIREMTEPLHHRGPDQTGYWASHTSDYQISFGHKRLSILDVSEAGKQPMHYKDYTIAYNGEIYNFKSIKEELQEKGHQFVSNSDTEMILHAYEEWGMECLERFIGMFAFSLYDKSKEKLYLVRDRFGVKPLYYSLKSSEYLIFGSELKALVNYSDFKKQISPKGLHLFFKYSYIESPYCIFEGVEKLNAGHYLTIDLKSKKSNKTKYWDLTDYYKKPRLSISFEDAKEELKKIFMDAFSLRMVSDVPVGIFLSGGFDSSTVAAVIQKQLEQKIKTFSIGFKGTKYDESVYAEKVAKILDTEHYTFNCDWDSGMEALTNMANYYDEPLADPSCIPTLMLSENTAKHVTVALSADGGDELFFGYDRHRKVVKYNNRLRKLGLLNSLAVKPYLNLTNSLSPRSYTKMLEVNHFNKSVGFLDIILQKYHNSFVHNLTNKYSDFNLKTHYNNGDHLNLDNELFSVHATDVKSYLTDNIMVKVDRASMAYSLENREPLLDQRIAEFTAQLPHEFLYKDKNKKRILKSICYDYLPEELMNRPKQGFMPPLREWLRTDMKEFLLETLSSNNLKKHGLINEKMLAKSMKIFQSGNEKNFEVIWHSLVFQLWYNKWM